MRAHSGEPLAEAPLDATTSGQELGRPCPRRSGVELPAREGQPHRAVRHQDVVLPQHRLGERDGLSVELACRGHVAANEMERSQAGHPFDRLRVSVPEEALAVGERTRKGLPGVVDLPGHAERHPLMVMQTGANRMVVGCCIGEQVEPAPSESRGLGETAPSTFDRAQGGEHFGLGRAVVSVRGTAPESAA